MITPAYAADASAGGAIFEVLFPLVMVFAIIYFMIIRPQQRRQKSHTEMISAVQRGDKVVTQGGLVGKVAKVNDDEVEIDVNDTRLTVIKTMLVSVDKKDAPKKD
ncbi:MAG: preprotein translocase subunit YajC [Alphaproteobacteria bacterium]|nr:preprotein translocase subunit YajC [Alphaproteobacteria bacterium]MBE8220681.1 preprotein translocase subunit YajC [Alphaproteobacteria bacterium]